MFRFHAFKETGIRRATPFRSSPSQHRCLQYRCGTQGGTQPCCVRFPAPCAPAPCSLLRAPCALLPAPCACSLRPAPCALLRAPSCSPFSLLRAPCSLLPDPSSLLRPTKALQQATSLRSLQRPRQHSECQHPERVVSAPVDSQQPAAVPCLGRWRCRIRMGAHHLQPTQHLYHPARAAAAACAAAAGA